MNQEKSAIASWLEEQDKTTSLAFELTDYSIWVNDQGGKVELSGRALYPLKRKLWGNLLVVGGDPQQATPVEDLPASFLLLPATGDVKQADVIGQLEYFAAMNTADGVVNEPASIAATVLVQPPTMERMVVFLSHAIGPWMVSLTITGLDRSNNGDRSWDTRTNPKLAITEFSFVLKNKSMPGASTEEDGPESEPSLTRVENALDAIRTKIESGVKLRLFS